MYTVKKFRFYSLIKLRYITEYKKSNQKIISKNFKQGEQALEIINLFPGSWCSNCYIISDNGHAAVIDPSASAKGILDYIKNHGLQLDFIIITHGHFDHIMSLDTLRNAANIPAYIHEYDNELLGDGEKNAFKTFFGKDRAFAPADKLLSDKDKLALGNAELEIMLTPGHTKGSVCIITPDFFVTGDTLFANSYGRCDLYGGSISAMRESLKKLRDFDKNLPIYPGHGESAKLGHALDNAAYL